MLLIHFLLPKEKTLLVSIVSVEKGPANMTLGFRVLFVLLCS